MDDDVPTEAVAAVPPYGLAIALQVGCIYRRTFPAHGNATRPPYELWRLLCVDKEHDELIFKQVAVRWDKVEKNAFIVRRDNALALASQGCLRREEDGVRPQFMSWDDDQLAADSPKAKALLRNRKLTVMGRLSSLQRWLTARDRDFAAISSLVALNEGSFADQGPLDSLADLRRREAAQEDLLVRAYSPRYCAASVRKCAEAAGCSQLVIRRLLHRYAWFGMGKNAMLKLDAAKGATGPLSRNNKRKSGPKDAAELVEGQSYAVRHRNEGDLPKFLYALTHYWADQHISMRAAYRLMVKTLYVSYNQDGPYRIRATHVPTERMFKYAAKTLIAKHRLDLRRAGDKDAMDISARRGYDTDIAPHVGTVFDIDGTPFNRELVSRWKVGNKRINIGKPYVVLVFERTSKKCVGWHVYLGNENWKEGYRLALFCAMTSKAVRLKWLRIDAPDAWPEGYDVRPAAVYVDGGPGASKKGQEAFKRLDIDFFLSPPDTPYWKPTVEGGLGHLQAGQAQTPGGYARTTAAVEKEAKRLAKLHANSTEWMFERSLVLDIMAYNKRVQEKARLTDLMKQDGVMRSANAIYAWGMQKMGGVDHRRILPAEAYEKLLDHELVELTKDGVRLLASTYQSRLLEQHFSLVGRCKISVFFDRTRPSVVYWRTPEGLLDALERDRQSELENGLASAYDIEKHRLHLRAAEQKEARPRGRGSNKLTRGQEDFALQAARAPRKPIRKTATKNETELRALEAAADLNSRPYDKAESFLPLRRAKDDASGADAGVASAAPARSFREASTRPAQTADRVVLPGREVSHRPSPEVAAAAPPSRNTVVPLKRSRSSAIFASLHGASSDGQSP